MQLYLQKLLRIDACQAVLFQNRDNCFSLLCFLPCLVVHIVTFFFSSFLPFFLFFPFSPFEFHGPPDKQSFCGASNKIFSSPARPVQIMLTSCCCCFFGGGGREGGNTRRFCTLSNIIHRTCHERLPIVTWCYKLKKANDAYLHQSLDKFSPSSMTSNHVNIILL